MAIIKKGDYSYQVEIRRKGYPAIYKTFDFKVDAEKYERQILVEMDQGIFIDRSEAQNTTLLELINRYEKEVSINKAGYEQERKRFNAFRKLPLAKRFISNLFSKDFAEYRDMRLLTVKPATARLDLALFSHIFTIAIKEWGYPITNPILNITMPKVDNARNRRLEALEEKYLLDACKLSPRAEIVPIVILAIETAMRKSEILRMEWKHVHINKSYVHLPKTKNGSERDVPLSPVAIKTLNGIPRNIKINRVFYNVDSEQITATFRYAKKRAINQYKNDFKNSPDYNPNFLVDFRLHDSRHEATSRLFESGKFEIMEVASITGHKSMSMLKRYTHLKAQNLAERMADNKGVVNA